VSALPPAPKKAGLIEKETNKLRTLNIERPTSNIVFCQFKKIMSNTRRVRFAREPNVRNFAIGFFKIDKAQCHQYWMFEVGRSMFDVQSVDCSAQVKSHKRWQRLENTK
jgi:hypothetical protein